MWWNLIGMAVKTGAEVFKNNQATQIAIESEAQKNYTG
jgi:hypothetical protein